MRRPRFPHLPGSADVLVGEYETSDSHSKKTRSERRSAPRPGSATHGYKKIRIRNNGAGGKASTVAGYVGPGFHNWPPSHIPQDTAPKPLLRIRSTAKNTFGEAFGAATGVSDPRLQKDPDPKQRRR